MIEVGSYEGMEKTLDWNRWLGVVDVTGRQDAGRARERMAWTRLLLSEM